MAGFMSKRERERRARERAEREKREREAREKSEREAREKTEREARERVEREQREREERERKEREEREAREREEQERARLKAQAASEAERKKAGRKWFERHVSRLEAVERAQFQLHLWERRSSYATEDEFGAALDGGYYEIAERYGEMRESDAAFDAYWENIKNLSDAELKAQDDKAWDAHDARISAIQAEIERVKAAWEAQAQNPPVQPQPPQPRPGSGQFGLMVFNEDGTLRDKVDSVFARFLHKEYLTQLSFGPDIPPNVKGSFVVEGLGSLPNGYRPFHFICSSGNEGSGYWWPQVRIEGNVVHWSYEYAFDPNDIVGAAMFSESTVRFAGDCFLVIGVCPDV